LALSDSLWLRASAMGLLKFSGIQGMGTSSVGSLAHKAYAIHPTA
jgi:hypothetical protein